MAGPAFEGPIVLFDGVCELCNRFVDAVLRADVDRIFRFASLQGRTASELLPGSALDPHVWSVVYLDDRGIRRESDAAIEICRRLGGWWRLLSLARIVPRPLRNYAYRIVARRRYAWFGRRDVCRVPDDRYRDRFLP